jgi:hypothetical protein
MGLRCLSWRGFGGIRNDDPLFCMSLRAFLSEAICTLRVSYGKTVFADCFVSRPTSLFGILAMTVPFFIPNLWINPST